MSLVRSIGQWLERLAPFIALPIKGHVIFTRYSLLATRYSLLATRYLRTDNQTCPNQKTYCDPNMTNNSLPDRLYLLFPGELPIDQQLSPSDRVKIRQSLQNLLQALNESSNPQALAIVDRELGNLDLSNVAPAAISATETRLKPWEVEDFNQCFKLAHVATEDKSICLVWGLLTVYKTLLLLEDDRQFNPSRVQDLKEGLKSHVRLIGRVFNLSLEEIK